MILNGAVCSAVLTAETITISGDYYRYDLHKRVKASGPVTADLLDVLRVGMTKTYSRLLFAFPMGFGILALLMRALPSVGGSRADFIADTWAAGALPLWLLSLPDKLWKLCAAACLLTIPLYWLSYRNDLEINTAQGRYLLPRKGMDTAQIAGFQREFTRLKEVRRKAGKGT